MVKNQNCVIQIWIILYIKTDDIYKDVAKDVESRCDTLSYVLECNSTERPLPKGKNEKAIGLMKNEFGGKIMIKFVVLRARTYSYLIDEIMKRKEQRQKKNCIIKRKPKFENYKNCFEATQLENKINYLE